MGDSSHALHGSVGLGPGGLERARLGRARPGRAWEGSREERSEEVNAKVRLALRHLWRLLKITSPFGSGHFGTFWDFF